MTASSEAATSITAPCDAAGPLTLMDLVLTLQEVGASDLEAVAAVLDLVETGRVQLLGPVRKEQPARH